MQIKAVALAVLLGLVAEAAQAQPRLISDVPYEGISPVEAVDIVRSTGLRPVARPQREGPYYIVHAVDSYGDTKRVVIDAEMGDVLRVRPVRGYVRSAPWYGRTPPEFGGGPRLWRREADRMGPPPGVVGRSWRAPPPRYGALDDDDDDLRPPRAVARPPMQGPPPVAPSASLPPPPDPVQRAPAGAVPVSPAPRTATAAPVAKPPLPRERPNREAARPAAANPRAAVTPEPPSAPRVVLPGGPPAKDEPKSETTASVPAAKPAAPEPAKTPAKAPEAAMPPVNPLE